MSIKSELPEVELVLNRLLDNILRMVSSQTGLQGGALRSQVGRVRADYVKLIYNGGLPISLLTCFRLAGEADIRLASLANLRNELFKETPTPNGIASTIIQMAILFCLSAESRMITDITFTSRDDADAMMKQMKTAFDTARDIVADAADYSIYRSLTALAGALTNHLATIELQLPRIIKFTLPPLPALAVSQRIYCVGDRSEELIAENKTIHPAFMARDLVGLSY